MPKAIVNFTKNLNIPLDKLKNSLKTSGFDVNLPGMNNETLLHHAAKDSDDNNTHEYMAFSGLSPAQRRDILLKKVKVHNIP